MLLLAKLKSVMLILLGLSQYYFPIFVFVNPSYLEIPILTIIPDFIFFLSFSQHSVIISSIQARNPVGHSMYITYKLYL